jgi:hypothetical protein
MTFSENLLGVSVFASPIYWLTHNPLTAHNVSLYLAWPLSAFGVYLLVEFLTRRRDAAFLAGLAFGFTPYRTAELGHIQVVSSYWFPALLGLHRYLDDRRVRWLASSPRAFVLQALANGYAVLRRHPDRDVACVLCSRRGCGAPALIARRGGGALLMLVRSWSGIAPCTMMRHAPSSTTICPSTCQGLRRRCAASSGCGVTCSPRPITTCSLVRLRLRSGDCLRASDATTGAHRRERQTRLAGCD